MSARMAFVRIYGSSLPSSANASAGESSCIGGRFDDGSSIIGCLNSTRQMRPCP